MNKAVKIKLVFIVLSLFSSCQNSEVIQPTSDAVLYYPNYVSNPIYKFEINKLTQEGIQLGRMLFYDPILSSDSSVSCGSCHSQAHAFADHNVKLSSGVKGKIGLRNSPPIFNLAWQPHFMWDGGVNHLEIVSLAPILNPLEMDETISNVLMKLNRNQTYKSQFLKVFNKKEIDDQMLFYTLTQFMGSITSFNSKYDEVRKGNLKFNIQEEKGYQLFKKHCNSCHSEPLFTDYSFRNNGIDSVFNDKGRFMISLNKKDIGLFKVPTLRNISLTYPYMHDGRFRTLEEVVNHYSGFVKKSETLDTLLSNPFKLSVEEKGNLIVFMKTLTDYQLLTNSNISEP